MKAVDAADGVSLAQALRSEALRGELLAQLAEVRAQFRAGASPAFERLRERPPAAARHEKGFTLSPRCLEAQLQMFGAGCDSVEER